MWVPGRSGAAVPSCRYVEGTAFTGLPSRFEVCGESPCVNAAVLEIDESTGAALRIARVFRRMDSL